MRNKESHLKVFSIKHLGWPNMLADTYYKKISTTENAAFKSLLRDKSIHRTYYFQTWPFVGLEKVSENFRIYYQATFNDLFGPSVAVFDITIDF